MAAGAAGSGVDTMEYADDSFLRRVLRTTALKRRAFFLLADSLLIDMGEPVKILDLARDMIRLSGHEPDVDIPIIYTGLRAGEKFFEEILGAEEGSEPTEHAKIFRARDTKQRDEMDLREKVERLIKLSEGSGKREEIVRVLAEIVPNYKPANAEMSICQW